MALRVYISERSGFTREREIYLMDENIDMARPVDKYQGHILIPAGNGALRYEPIKEGERLPENAHLLRLPEQMMDDFLRSMAVELIRTGYITGDPHGTKMRAVEEHLKTLELENNRKHEMLSNVVTAMTLVLPKLR